MAYQICPERMVPSLKDKDRETGERINVFDGTVCLQYLADRFDVHGERSGYTAAERGAVFTWVAYQTVGIE
jgi:glutathione S-transferase